MTDRNSKLKTLHSPQDACRRMPYGKNSKLLNGLSVLLCILLAFIGGCGKMEQSAKVDKTGTPVEQEKSKLLRQIDRKFENPDAHFELGQLYHADGMWAKAEYHYNVALSFDPAHRNSQAATVKVLLDRGDTSRSEISADIYTSQASGSAVESLRLGLAFQKQRLDDYALGCYQQALRLAPNSAKINRQIGYYYLSKGDNVLAKEYLSRSFQLDPRQGDVAGELGRMGVAVRIPRKTKKSTKELDKMVNEADKASGY